jgi:hypothetical protein
VANGLIRKSPLSAISNNASDVVTPDSDVWMQVERLEQATLARHLARPFQRLEGDELSASLRLGALDHVREREANPGMTIDQPSTQRWR